MDWSTIDLGVLHSLPTWYPGGGTLRVSEHPGSGCFGDPPGYPSYFVRHVYTANGDTPHRASAPELVIAEGEDAYVLAYVRDYMTGRTALLRRLRRLWAPLPYEHERVQLWIRSVYRHQRNCYRDDAGAVTEPNDGGTLIFPVPYYKLRSFVDDARFSEEWRAAERTAIAAYNDDVRARARAIAIPDNHSAVRQIRAYYPEHMPDLQLISNPGDQLEGDWWQTEAERPTIEACTPRSGSRFGAADHSTQWCQWCGRNPGKEMSDDEIDLRDGLPLDVHDPE